MPTYLLGDVQGCYEPLQRLLEKVNFDPASDRLWGCGDLVNRGGQSLEVLRLLHGMGGSFRTTLGNHDLHLLACHYAHPDGHVSKRKLSNKEFRAILNAPDRVELMHWLQHMPLAHWFADHQLLLLHAGVIPQWDVQQTLECAGTVESVLRSGKCKKFLRKMYRPAPRRWRQDRSRWKQLRFVTQVLTRLRFCNAKGIVLHYASGPPGSQPKGYVPWFELKKRRTKKVRIAFGHWAALGLRINKKIIALDSGCVWGGKLSAFRLEDEQLFQVKGPK